MRAPSDPQEIEDIIDAFYASSIGEASTLDAVRLLQASFGAASAQIFSMASNETVTFSETIVAHNPSTHAAVSEKIIEENWEGLEVGVDPRMAYSSTLPAGFVFHDYQFISDREIDKHPFYQEFLRKFDLRYDIGANLEVASPTDQTLLSFNHSETQGAISAEQMTAFGLIVPHAQRAMKMRRQLQETQSVKQSLMTLLDNRGTGIALLDRQGNVVEMNATLTKMLASDDGLTLTGRRLRPSSAFDQRHFDELLAELLRPADFQPKSFRETLIHRPSGKHHYIVNAVPINAQREILRDNLSIETARSIKAVLSISDPVHSRTPDVSLVRSYFGLTYKEALIACDLASGITLSQAATKRNITNQTARSHLKSIFSKTAITRQSDLVRLIANLSN